MRYRFKTEEELVSTGWRKIGYATYVNPYSAYAVLHSMQYLFGLDLGHIGQFTYVITKPAGHEYFISKEMVVPIKHVRPLP